MQHCSSGAQTDIGQSLTQQPLGNIEQMDLTRAFVNSERTDITIKALNPATFHVALATKNLHYTIRNAAAHLC